MTGGSAADLLELPKVLELIAPWAFSQEGASRLRSLEPLTDPTTLSAAHDAVGAIMDAMREGVAAPVGHVDDVRHLLKRVARVGAVLELEELAAIRRLLEAAEGVRSFLNAACERGGERILAPLDDPLRRPPSLWTEVAALIDPAGALREEAVPGLTRARQAIATANRTLMREAERLIDRDPAMYREDRATVRDGRVVLPLAANFRGRVEGIIHEASGSGETLFVEPPELVTVNNDLARAHGEVLQLIHRALADLSAKVRSEVAALERLTDALVEADTLIARARYGLASEGALLAQGPTVDLRGARHPLLGAACVPLTFRFDPPTRLAVISGPNTGGKTVMLKTLGLLSMLNQSAVPVPAEPDSVLPVFAWWGVDIGDDQAIDRHLSTFSAHIRRLAEICDRADDRSLVLLDELGTGTDPDEGAALSLAIVDHLLERGAVTVVTTHQARLKHYGFTRSDATNFSMAFDERSHRPTYAVTPGQPGASHAIETAREQGLRPEIVDAAEAYREERGGTVVELIERLTREAAALEEARAALAREREETHKRQAELATREIELESREADLAAGTAEELRAVASDARRRLENTVRQLRERGASVERAEIRAAHEELREVESHADRLVERHPRRKAPAAPEPAGPPGVGEEVEHRETGRVGTVLSIRGEKVTVRFGSLRMTVPVAMVRRRAAPDGGRRTTGAPPMRASVDTEVSTPRALLEVDLRGMRLEEARAELERQVDAAILAGVPRFGVIHGTGSGVLQKGVRDYLATRAEVASVAFAVPEEGGFGKTLVELQA